MPANGPIFTARNLPAIGQLFAIFAYPVHYSAANRCLGVGSNALGLIFGAFVVPNRLWLPYSPETVDGSTGHMESVG